jgi:ankyrin repeat protein
MKKDTLFDRDPLGRTGLFYAAESGLIEEVREIIFSLPGTGLFPARLALISIKDCTGLTASELAQQNGHKAIAKLLLGEQGRMEYCE